MPVLGRGITMSKLALKGYSVAFCRYWERQFRACAPDRSEAGTIVGIRLASFGTIFWAPHAVNTVGIRCLFAESAASGGLADID
jgi:hypothetical protein